MLVVTYGIDKSLYDTPSIHHNIALTATEYSYKKQKLIHLEMNKPCNNLLDFKVRRGLEVRLKIQDEQFLFINKENEAKVLSRRKFGAKRKRFDMKDTAVRYEMLEEYYYIDRDKQLGMVQILIRTENGCTYAEIDFKNFKQYKNFVLPDWLICLAGCETLCTH